MIVGILARDYLAHRPDILPFLQGFVDRSLGQWTLFEMEEAITEGQKQVWSINGFQGLCLTSVGHESVNIDHCAGERRHEWEHALGDEIEAWARALGKKRVIAMVRPGWAPLGRQRGYREAHREMVKEL